MPTDYLVTLGDGILAPGDAVGTTARSFSTDDTPDGGDLIYGDYGSYMPANIAGDLNWDAEDDEAAPFVDDATTTLVNPGAADAGLITTEGEVGAQSTGDTQDLTGLADPTTLTMPDAGGGASPGSVTMLDGTLVTFSNVDTVICFTPGTRILTALGYRPIDDLRPGDLLITRDSGARPLRWIGRSTTPAIGAQAPILIEPGLFEGQERTLMVSPQHRMLFAGHRARLLFDTPEVLVAAGHLLGGPGVSACEGGFVTYIHLMLDRHEVLYAEGAATESFHVGHVGLGALSTQAREAMFRVFPALRASPDHYGDTARQCLTPQEAASLRDFGLVGLGRRPANEPGPVRNGVPGRRTDVVQRSRGCAVA